MGVAAFQAERDQCSLIGVCKALNSCVTTGEVSRANISSSLLLDDIRSVWVEETLTKPFPNNLQ
jgi:hypothetical protein